MCLVGGGGFLWTFGAACAFGGGLSGGGLIVDIDGGGVRRFHAAGHVARYSHAGQNV